MNMINGLVDSIRRFFRENFSTISAETLGWLAAIVVHCATVPTLLALLTGLSDNVPNLDIVLFAWAGLVLLFGRAVLLRDNLNIVTIGVGFIVQAVLLAMIVFK